VLRLLRSRAIASRLKYVSRAWQRDDFYVPQMSTALRTVASAETDYLAPAQVE
jgi:hypothetical protein